MVALEMGNRETISVIIETVVKRKNTSHKSFTFELPVKKIELTGKVKRIKKCCNLKQAHF